MIDNEDFKFLLIYFDKLYYIKDEIEREYQMTRASEECKLPLESIRRMFEKYKLRKSEAESPLWKKPFLRAEILNERLNDFLSEMDLFKTLDFLSKLSLLVAVILFIREIPEQAERQRIQERQNRYQAWQIIIAGQDRKSKTSSGRIEALEFLNEGKVSLHGLEAPNAYLAKINLSNADLSGANLQNANLTNAKLENSKLENVNLNKANLTGANLENANLTDAKLENANLTGAKLENANLTDAKLENANLTGAKLNNINLTDAKLENANLTGAKLNNINFTLVDITNVVSWENADVSNADFSGHILNISQFAKVNFLNNSKFNNTLIYTGSDEIYNFPNTINEEYKKLREQKKEAIIKAIIDGGGSIIDDSLKNSFSIFNIKNIKDPVLKLKIIKGAEFTWEDALVRKEYISIPSSEEHIRNIIKAAHVLNQIQKKFGKPIAITSWYRDPARNRRIGGSRSSRHLYGDAVAITPSDGNFSELLRIVREEPTVTGIGNALHRGFIQINVNSGKRFEFNYP